MDAAHVECALLVVGVRHARRGDGALGVVAVECELEWEIAQALVRGRGRVRVRVRVRVAVRCG